MNSSQGGGSKDTWVLAGRGDRGTLVSRDDAHDTREVVVMSALTTSREDAMSGGTQQEQQQQQQQQQQRRLALSGQGVERC